MIVSLVGSAVAAPTPTIKNRQLGGSGTISGLGALTSILDNIPSSGYGIGSSGSGFTLPSIPASLSNLGTLGGFKRQLGSSTENGVTENNGCKALTLIFARGTGELGNMGTVAGPPLAEKLQSLTDNKVTVQGVNYDASAAV